MISSPRNRYILQHHKTVDANAFSSALFKNFYSIKTKIQPYGVIFFVFAFLTIAYIFSNHYSSTKYPSLTYPLSEYNVEVFHNAVSSKTTNFGTRTFPFSGMINAVHTPNIYGPLEPHPIDHFKPFNINSLLFVTFMFLSSWLLLL